LRAPSSLEAKILHERKGIEGERKQVTVMYTDIVGSMALTRSLDNERYGYVLDRFLAVAAGAVHKLEGTVNQFTGDGLMAVFGAPLAHEDHARRACLAVLELQSEVAELAAEVSKTDGIEFSIRCGLNSGDVVVGAIGDDVHMDFVPIGNTTALGKRIESLAPVGSTAISASTAALVEGEFELLDLGEFELKGADEPQRVLELVGPGAARTRLEATAATRGLSRFMGRGGERAQLESMLDETLAGNGRAVEIVGDAGVGKSRLVHEFVTDCAARGLRVNSTGGVNHGRYVPFLPVLALYRDYFGISERDAPEIARERIEVTMLALDPAFAADLPLLFEFLGVPDPDRPLAALDPEVRQRRLVDLTTRTVKARSEHEAAVLVLEDVHCIDDASAAFLERLMDAVVGTRILLVVTFRPEYAAAWRGHGRNAQLILFALDAEATGDLLTALLGDDQSLDGLPALIESRSGGNPFFLEEIVQALAESGHLAGTRGDYRLAAELDGLVLPASVEAGLAARIDRLPGREKALVQTMAVIGAEIPGALLSEVSDLPDRHLAESVAVLAGAQMVIPDDSAAGVGYVFKHPLTQDVAYGSLLSEGRARAHQSVAAAIERTYPDGLDERAALLAYHCEASGDTLDAAGWHARAAAWVQAASPAEGMRHWRRVGELAGDVQGSLESDELTAAARRGILSLGWRVGMSPEELEALHAEAQADLGEFVLDLHYAGSLMHSGRERDALELFRGASRPTGDPGRVLTASLGVAYANWVAGSLSAGVEALDRALRLAGDDPDTGAGLAFMCPLAHAYGHRAQCLGHMGELERARHEFRRAIELARENDDPETESDTYAKLAMLEADAGETEAALDNAALGLAIAERMDNPIGIVVASTTIAAAEADAGRFASALVAAEANLGTIRQLRTGLYFEPLLLATIARSKLALGMPEDALAAAEEAVEIMDARGLATCALRAPIALAQVLLATEGAAVAERIEAVLAGATRVIDASEARLFEAQVQRASQWPNCV
jgi:class 3 adenylate cyclase/tetratricopeptide (TPR) repeat protein